MSELTICLFGHFRLLTDSVVSTSLPQKPKQLLSILALEPESQLSRLAIAEKIWPNRRDNEARDLLSKLDWRLRSLLSDVIDGGNHLIKKKGDTIWFNPDGRVDIDVHLFSRLLEAPFDTGVESLSDEDVQALESCAQLYKGELLVDVFLDDDWCLVLREFYHGMYQRALEALFRHHILAAQWSLAIAVGDTLIGHDPLLEHIHRELMRCHAAMGNGGLAARQFNKCADALERDLGIPPMEETLQTYALISASAGQLDAPISASAAVPVADREKVERLSRRITSVLKTMRSAEKELDDILLDLNRSGKSP